MSAPNDSKAAPARICFPFVGDDIGGSHISALKLIEHLPSRFRPRILLHAPDGTLARYLDGHGVPWEPAPDVFARPVTPWRTATRVLPALRRVLRDFDIVHTNDGRIHALWGPATLGLPCRHLWHHRGDPGARGVNRLAPLVADHLVTVSRFSYPTRPLRSMRGRWDVVHSPFDHPPAVGDRAAAHAALCDELGLPPLTRFVGFFGGFVGRKRPQMMADIVAACRAARPDLPVHAVLFGHPPPDGPRLDHATTERARELGVADRVHLMGFREPVDRWMRAVDLLLVPALSEPFGRTLIEAMLLGTPVIATRHGGNVEAIEEGGEEGEGREAVGHLVDPHDPAAFVAPVAALLDDPAAHARLAARAREAALARYGTATHVRAITRIYDHLLRPAARPFERAARTLSAPEARP